MAGMFKLSECFRAGARSGARRGQNPLVGLPLAVVSGAGGVALAAAGVAGVVATCVCALAAFGAMMIFNVPAIVLWTGLTVAGSLLSNVAMAFAATTLGMAKGALFDGVPETPRSSQRYAPTPAPQAPVSVPKYAGVPPKSEFNAGASPFAPSETAWSAQSRRNGPKPR